jgi:hypothetical protein
MKTVTATWRTTDVYDEVRYACMARPIIPKKTAHVPQGTFASERNRYIKAKKYAEKHGVSLAAAYEGSLMARASKADQERQKLWEDRIHRAKSVRSNWKKLFKVQLGLDYFEGKQNPGYPEEEWLTINKIYSHIKATLPSLYSVHFLQTHKISRRMKSAEKYGRQCLITSRMR